MSIRPLTPTVWLAALGMLVATGPLAGRAPMSMSALPSTGAEQAEPKTEPKAEKKDLPLEPAGKIEFDTDEGTWISLDVTPDGQTIVFELLGDLYKVPIAGGDATRLTDGLPFDSQPRVSPDGARLAFISDRDGADNLWIAYVTWSMQGGHVWKMRADGSGQPQQLTATPAFYTDLVFSPDGSQIVVLRGNEYMRTQTFSEFGGLRIPLDLVWLPAGGGDVTLVVPARGLGYPHFASGDGRIYVYSDDGLISLRDDGTDRRTHLKVTGPGRAGAPRPPAADAVLMRPDGKWALASVNNQLWVVAVPPYTGQAGTVNVRSPSLPAKRLTDIGADYFWWADELRR